MSNELDSKISAWGLGSQYSSVKLKRVPDPAQLPNATLFRGDRLFVFLCTLPRLAQWR